MKKITFILYLFVFQSIFSQLPEVRNFSVTANSAKTWTQGDRFDFRFEIRGNYGTNEIKLWIYKGAITSKPNTTTNLVVYSRWNREGDDFLNFPNYTVKPYWARWWNKETPPYNIEGKTFTLIAEYNGTRRFLLYQVPNSDTDGDGIPNAQDQCPTQAGPASNNGCPIPKPTGPAKIEIQKVVVKRDDGTTVYNSSVSNSRLTVNNNYAYEIEVTIKNTGGTRQSKIQWVVAESSNNSLDVFSDCTNTGGGSSSVTVNLDPGQTTTGRRSISVFNGKIGQCNARTSGYMMIAATTETLSH